MHVPNDVFTTGRSGIARNSEWTTKDQIGMWKTNQRCLIEKVFSVRLGSMLNVSDLDAEIKLVWSRENHGTAENEIPLTLNLEQNLNGTSIYYNEGLFYLNNDGPQPDNETLGFESATGWRNSNNDELANPDYFDDEIEEAVADICATAEDEIDNENDDEAIVVETIKFSFTDLLVTTQKLKFNKLKLAFRLAEEQLTARFGCTTLMMKVPNKESETSVTAKVIKLGYTISLDSLLDPDDNESVWLKKTMPDVDD